MRDGACGVRVGESEAPVAEAEAVDAEEDPPP